MNRLVKGVALLALGSRYFVGWKLNSIRKAGVLTILNLHRVAEDDGSSYRPLSPRLFEELLVFLKKNFKITTFGELMDVSPSKKPKVILSFDDGYKDFINFAMPILEKHGVRVNQNIIPECVEGQAAPLNVIATDFIGRAPLSLLNQLNIPGFDAKKYAENRMVMGELVSNLIKYRPMTEQKTLGDMLLPQFYNWDKFEPTPMMSRDEVQQIIGTHEIGAHSYSHAAMEFETDDYFQEDLSKCREYFLNVLGSPVDIYAFPNGAYRKSQLKIACDSGYKHILVVDNLFSRNPYEVYYRFNFDALSEREVFFRAVGGLARIDSICTNA